MLTASETLADGVAALKTLLGRFLADFADEDRTRTADHLPNHVIWTLGHAALYLNRAAERLDGQPLPASDFVTGDGHGGNPQQYDTEAIAFDSKPGVAASAYPTLARGRAIFEAACDRLSAAVRAAKPKQLQQNVPWVGTEIPLYALVLRLVFHCGFHAGQIADLRRALGLGRVIR
ncbi:MAG: DinB family protein [Planctomycetota bacterium]